MSWIDPDQRSTMYDRPSGAGPVAQTSIVIPPPGVPATVGAGLTWTSGLQTGDGFKAIAAGVTLSQAGTIQIQRFLDSAGLVMQGGPVSSTLIANTPGVVNCVDNLPFATFTVSITNDGVATGNVSNFAVLMNAE